MKLDYLKDVNPDYPNDSIVRLYNFNENEVHSFMNDISTLLKSAQSISLHKQPYISTSTISIVLALNNTDIGIKESGKNSFICKLTKETYAEMIKLIESFSKEIKLGTYQWLYDIGSDIEFLFSPNGDW